VGMSAEQSKDIVRRGMEALFTRDGDLDSLDETYSQDYVGHAPPFPDIVGLLRQPRGSPWATARPSPISIPPPRT
jgi:hypothetical protein